MEVLFNHYIRKPFVVEAIQITPENIENIASVLGERRASTDLPERLRPPVAPRSNLQKKGGKS